MARYELKKGIEGGDPRRSDDRVDLPATPRDPIEPDPMNPGPPADPDSKPAERPDLDWAEHED